LYDFSSGASDLQHGGTTVPFEDQNNIEERIQERTPKLKTQYKFIEGRENVAFDLQSTPDAHFSVINSLGSSDQISTTYPSWDIRMFGEDGPKIKRAVEYMTASFGILKIPQLDVDVDFKTAISSISGSTYIKEDKALSSATQADGTYISVEPRTIVMQVLEKYSIFEKENFDIEVFLKETEVAHSGSSHDVWTPLVFKKKMSNIVDGILVDEQPEVCQDIDSTHVEYYFDIFVDKEINETILEGIVESLKTQNMYLPTTNASANESTFEIADIYSQVVPDDACSVAEDKCP